MMKLGLALGFAATGAAAAETEANPIRKVVTLLQDMQKEIEAEGETEKELYEKFMCFCKGNTSNLTKAAEEAAAKIEELRAKQKADEAEKAQLTQDLIQHKKDRANAKQDLATATKIRSKEHEQYLSEAGDTKKNIDALNGAIPALEKGMGVTGFLQSAAATSLKQVITNFADVASPSDREEVLAFLSADKDYAPQSGQIVGILKNMKDEMDKSLGGIVSEEEAAAKNFLELKKAKEEEIAAAGSAIEAKTARAGELAVAIVQTKDAIEDSTAELEDSQKFAAELSVTCKEKTAEWEERTKTRNEEIAAISEAISILNDDDALDLFKQTLPTPKVPGVAFLQRSNKGSALKKARSMIETVKKATKNPALALLSNALVSKVRAGEKSGKMDFSVVLKMIDDMVTLLKKEQADDESHRDYCNREFDTSEDEQKEVKNKITSLSSTISELKDGIQALKDELASTKAKIEALDESVAEATSQRKKEHAEFTQMMQMNEAAVQLIFKAKNRMQKFYNPSMYVAPKQRELTDEDRAVMAAGGEVDRSLPPQMIAGTTQTVFIQLHRSSSKVAPPVPPETFGAYQNKSQKSGGVLGLMDMLTKELEKDMQAAEHEEKTANKDYTELVADAQETRAQDVKSITTAENSKAELETELDEAKTQSIMKNDELQQIQTYIQDLHSSCDFILANFEVRREARSNEIDSLSNAKSVLSGANYQ